MNRLALAAVLLAATATTASAGGFVGLGIGTSPGTSGGVAFQDQGRSGRLELGYSFGHLAIEGLGGRFDLLGPDGATYQDTTLGLAATYGLPLGNGFEAFGRLGYQSTSLSPSDSARPGHSGSGLLFGAGFKFRLPIAAAQLSAFVDYTIANSHMTPDGTTNDYSLTTRIWTLGAILGF